jgi:hypothetical protein
MKTKFLLPVLAAVFAIGMSFTSVKSVVLANDYVLDDGTWIVIAEQNCPSGLKTCRVQFGEGGQIFDVYDEMNLSTKKKNTTDAPTVINP